MSIRYRDDKSASINALKLISSGVTSVAEIAKQTGLSDSQVRYRFKHDIAKKKAVMKLVGNATPLEVKVNSSKEDDSSSILALLKVMQKEMSEMRKEIKELRSALADNWFENPYITGAWDISHSDCSSPYNGGDKACFKRTFTGSNPENCLVEVEYSDGKKELGLADSFDWSINAENRMINTKNHGDIKYCDFKVGVHDLGGDDIEDLLFSEYERIDRYIAKYRMIQPGE